jgi:hypothetical protein
MISVKKIGEGKRTIEASGSHLEIIEDLLALIDSITRTVFQGSDRDRIEFLKDIPDLISEVQPQIFTLDLPYRPEDLKT